ncbi:MAG: glycosyltransferase [bacterium]
MAYATAVTRDPGITVWLLSTKYPDIDRKNIQEVGERIYICGNAEQKTGNNSFTERTSGKLFGKKTFRKFLENVDQFLDAIAEKKTVLVYPSINNFSDERELLRMIKSKGIPVFSERNELNVGKMLNYPFPKNLLKKLLFAIYYPFKYFDHYRQDKLVANYDGNIVISRNMEERIRRLNPNILRIPILADIKKFSSVNPERKEDHDLIHLGFTGYLTMKKDSIGELIRAVRILKNKYGIDNVRLNLYGTGYRDTLLKIYRLIDKLHLKENVVLHGQVPSEQIPEILSQQNILLLIRSDNLQTRFGFSTKLAEYMASGVPVLITSVSDNTTYVKDGENGFVSCSHKASDTAERLFEIISRKDYLDESIGKKARETALEHFDASKYSDMLINFFFQNSF